jgi:hypothetical protein
MIETGVKVFLGLVALLYVVHNPEGVVHFAQAICDAAFRLMKALVHLNPHI